MNHEPGELTQIIRRARQNDKVAEEQLMEMIYEELHRLAKVHFAGERPSHTLSPTGLVHDAYILLAGLEKIEYQDRQHFLSMASRMMRRVLVDHARKRGAEKRGGAAVHIDVEGLQIPGDQPDDQLSALNEALDRLEKVKPRLCRVVELRFFAGMTETEIAKLLNKTRRTITRDWQLARAMLFEYLARGKER